jgi:hypothetical protein
MMSDYPGAIDYFVDESRVFINQNSHSAIVIHGTGGDPNQTAQQLGDYFRSTPEMTSVHYGIDRSGVVCQYVLESDGAGGNGILEPGHDPFWDQFQGDNPNRHTLSIEHVNDSSNSLALTDAQKATSFRLIGYLSKKYSIPFSCIKSHASIAPQSRALCPGPAYPWDELEASLQNGGNSMGVPNGWHDDGTTLIAPNGVQVTQGFRQFVLAHDWDPGNWPLMAAVASNPVEVGNPSLGGGTVQPFRITVLAWTAQRGVYVMWVGQEYLALYAGWNKTNQDLHAAQAQVVSLEAQIQALQNANPLMKDLQNRLNQVNNLSGQITNLSRLPS